MRYVWEIKGKSQVDVNVRLPSFLSYEEYVGTGTVLVLVRVQRAARYHPSSSHSNSSFIFWKNSKQQIIHHKVKLSTTCQ